MTAGTMIPFSISAALPMGIVANRLEDIHLDGILAYVAVKTELGEAFWQPGHVTIEAQLPLTRREHGGTYYWSCSRAHGDVEMRDIHYWHRRFDDHHEAYLDFRGKRGRVKTEGGPMRDMRGALSILYPESITWYLHGDPDAVWEMLRSVPYIGKHTNMGQGRVWWGEPQPIDEDWSVWRGNELTRSIPAEEAEEVGGEYQYEYAGIRPPYWEPTNQQLCAVSGHAG